MIRWHVVPLRRALLLPLLLILSGTAGLICIINARNAERSAEQLAIDLQRQTTRVVSVFLTSELRGPQQAIQAMDAAVASGLIDPHHEKATALYLSRLARLFPNAPYLNYGLTDGTYIGVGQGGNQRSDELVLVVTTPDAIRKITTYKLHSGGQRGELRAEREISDFRQATWYSQPLKAGRAIWTEIYNWDDQPEVMALGAGLPIRRNGQVIGVAGVDMILANISAKLRQVAGDSGVVLYIMDDRGLLVANSNGARPFDLIRGRAIRRPATQDRDPWIRTSARHVVGATRTLGPSGPVKKPLELRLGQGKYRGLLRVTPWGDPRGLQWQIVAIMPESRYADIISKQTQHTLGITLLAILGAGGVGWVVVGLVCRPLEQVTSAVEALAAGQRPRLLLASPIGEIDRLTRSFGSMAAQLTRTLVDLQERHEAVERQIVMRSAELSSTNAKLQAELSRAAAIQAEMLMQPDRFANLTQALDSAVRLVPSKEVAGDLYDAIPMGSDRFCFCIGDVSGKGMPAALLMSTCLSLLRTYAELLDKPSAIMQRINRHLCDGNEDCTFTTLLIAIYDSQSGDLRYCNAGHNPAMLRRSIGEVVLLDQIHGPALGIATEFDYGEALIRLEIGDSLIAYTDGANETFNRSRQRFGLNRMRAVMERSSSGDASTLLNSLLAELELFADGEPHHDDTTMLAIHRLGTIQNEDRDQDSLMLGIGNHTTGIAEALEQVRSFGRSQNLPKGKLRNLLVVIDELLNNIVNHGCKHLGDQAVISLEIRRVDERLVILFNDNGIAFNPIERRSPDVASQSDERPIGGLGIHLMRGLTKASRYQFEGGMNQLTLEM